MLLYLPLLKKNITELAMRKRICFRKRHNVIKYKSVFDRWKKKRDYLATLKNEGGGVWGGNENKTRGSAFITVCRPGG